MDSNTLQVIRHYLSNSVGDLTYGNAGTTGATTTLIYAPFLWQADDYYNNHKYEAYVYLGTNIGVTKRVTDWVLSTFLLTVHSAYDNACDATSFVELHRIFTEDDYRKAINLAIGSLANGTFVIDKTDATITLVADVYEYTVPAGFSHIHRITTEKTAGTGLFQERAVIDNRDWRLISPRKIKFHESHYGVTAGKDLRIEGQGKQEKLTSDASVCYIPMDWLVQKAITFLPMNKIQNNSLLDTYKAAIALSQKEPRRWPHHFAQRVVE